MNFEGTETFMTIAQPETTISCFRRHLVHMCTKDVILEEQAFLASQSEQNISILWKVPSALLFSGLPSPVATQFLLEFYAQNMSVSGLLHTASFSQYNNSEIYPGCWIYQEFISFYCWMIFHSTGIPYCFSICKLIHLGFLYYEWRYEFLLESGS